MAKKKRQSDNRSINKNSFQVKKKYTFKKANDPYEWKLKKAKVINYLRTELRTSSTHGLPYIVNTEIHWFERFFWTVWFLICCVIIVMLLSSQYKRFIETPTVMSVEMDYFNWNVSYPAFTLCPLFKPDSKAWEHLLKDMYQKNAQGMDGILWSIVSSGGIGNLEKYKLEDPKGNYTVEVKDYAILAAKSFKRLEGEGLTTSNNEPVAVDAAMTELGMCHVINSNVAKYDNPFKWTKNVSTQRYVRNNVLLSVHDRDFFTQIMDYGIIYEIYIHSPDEMILSTSQSYLQKDPGFLSFGVQVFSSKISDELRRFPIRVRKCRLINEPISKRYPIYSYNHCMIECRIKMIKTVCNCIPHFYKPLDNEKICSLEQLKCVLKYKKQFTSLSATDRTRRNFGSTLPRSPRDCACLSSCETDIYSKDYESFIGNKLSRLRIGISSFPKARIVRDIIFSYYDIILRSGGVVNLCIGSSLLSLVEAILVALKCLLLLFKI